MVVKSIVLMRHAEREDRAQEKEGKDWISTAPRPQDPVLSANGRKQAIAVGAQLKDVGITKILCSPMIRTVISADLVADEIGINTIYVEKGLVEESKSFRGKTADEPRPNWNPLILPPTDLKLYSNKVDVDYQTLLEVQHVRDESKPNTVREVHETLTDRDEITRDRCKAVLHKIIMAEALNGETVLCVGHGATVLAMSRVLEAELPEDQKIGGERTVSCFSEFRPVDPSNPMGPWKSVTGAWRHGDVLHEGTAEAPEDRGLA